MKENGTSNNFTNTTNPIFDTSTKVLATKESATSIKCMSNQLVSQLVMLI